MSTIAIIGQGCVLPGALDVASFATNVLTGVDSVRDVPAGRWRVSEETVRGTPTDWADKTWSTAGGYVKDFASVWSGDGYGLPAADLAALDPVVRWLVHAGRSALHSARLDVGDRALARTGAVFGNLSFPTDGMARWGEAWLRARMGAPPIAAGDPRNLSMSGLPAALLAQALGLGAQSFALDAACASALYAIRLACDALEAGRADLMLAGGVNASDSLFIHIGFSALGAMSKTGQSRPFHRGADGLVPAEGAALVLLKRLADAERDGDTILGVIRGVGLSNDGRGRNLLAPSAEGQVRAMRDAYRRAGLTPADIDLVECHATGTPTGDRTEVDSLTTLFADSGRTGVPLGSYKSNVGHLITVAGVAGLMKVLAGMAAETRPPTLHVEDPLGDLGPFRLLAAAEPWSGPVRRAAVSAFGFGGNNAHLVVESWRSGSVSVATAPLPDAPIQVVGLAASRGSAADVRALLAAPPSPRRESVRLPLTGLRFPPNDLRASLGQQTLALAVVGDALADAGLDLPRERVAVLVAMSADPTVTGWGARWRLDQTAWRDAAAPSLRAEHVIGTMPNIPANRISVQWDYAGPGFTVSAEEASPLVALTVARDLLSSGEVDAVVVAAVDLASDPRFADARRASGRGEPGFDDAAAVVLTRGSEGYARIDVGDPRRDAPSGPPGAAALLVDLVVAIARAGRGETHTVATTTLGGARAAIQFTRSARDLPPRRVEEGPMLELPLHPVLPGTGTQVMAPAPRLTPTTGGGAGPPVTAPPTPVAAPRPAAVVPVAAPLAAPPPPVAAPRPGVSPAAAAATESAPTSTLDLLVAHQRQLGEAHARFVETQGRVQAAFLAERTQTLQALLGRMGAAPAAPAVARPAVSPPASVPIPVPVTRAEPAPTVAPPPAAAAPPPAPVASPPAARVAPPHAPVAPVAHAPAPAASPVAAPAPSRPVPAEARPGPRLSRAQLESGSSGSITTIFGPAFAPLDAWDRVVRMPEPPLLLADRVTGIEGPPLVLGKGTIWTETDVRADSWYLHDGRMPGGILIESGQADLLLVSWQGIDLLNRGDRIYRLLGCTLTYHRALPKPGDTLSYDIHVDGHAKLGDVRMFFFHYDCHVGSEKQISIREGQAGFFTNAELGDSGGVLWDAATAEVDLTLPHAAGPVRPTNTRLDRSHLEALADGRVADCFGASHGRAHTHTHTPRIAAGRMLFLDRAEIDLEGGPWKRGYLRAEQDIRPDHWFFDGHFKNDPCMPGTLMFDGCLQAMQVYLTALGYTLTRDAWRFEPAKDIPFKLRCRGQVTPPSKTLVYEIFVIAVEEGLHPRLHAQVLCTVDGLKCFHADPIVLELVPDWPMTRMPPVPLTRPPGAVPYDWPQLLACAWGEPNAAFGSLFDRYSNGERSPRLPGPPYHFMTRVTKTSGEPGAVKPGGVIDVEYDVPPSEWYFAETGGTMPFAVLLEAALQPCGWLASWTGGSLVSEGEVLFRNLDGTGTWHAEVKPDAGMLTTRTKLHQLSKSAGMVIVGFELQMTQGGKPLYDLKTVFGFFPPAAFANQAGVGSTAEERAWLAEPNDFHVELRSRPSRYFDGTAHLPTGMLLMLDRVTGRWPTGGKAGLGRWRAEKDVNQAEWMFKAHFFQDPVQPGSLGLEAIVQLLQFSMIETGIARPGTRFEPLAMGVPMTWKYRGQVTPDARLVQLEVEIVSIAGDLVIAEGHLWVDGKRIYSTTNLGMRVIPVAPPPSKRTGTITLPSPEGHRPTYVLPAQPMTGLAMVALAAANATSLVDGVALRWLTFPDGPRPVHVKCDGDRVTLATVKEAHGHAVAGDTVFSARIAPVPEPAPPADLIDPTPGEDGATLYASGELFHDGDFRVVERVIARGRNGASLQLFPAPPDRLLDGATHGIPHDRLHTLDPSLPADKVGYPSRLKALALYGAPPAGPVRCEVRLLGVEGGKPRFGAWFYAGDRLAAWYEVEEVLLPKGRLGEAAPAARRDFLQGRYVSDVSLARISGDRATLTRTEVAGSDWLPGTLLRVYGSDTPSAIAARELEGQRLRVHPRHIVLEPVADGFYASDRHHPLATRHLAVRGDVVTGGALRYPDLDVPIRWWRRFLDHGAWEGEDILRALATEGLADLHVHDPDAFAALHGKPVLYLANHESYLESVLFSCIVSGLGGLPVAAVAKREHDAGWLGDLHRLLVSHPTAHFPPLIRFFDQSDPASLRGLVLEALEGRSLLVHVEGTRQVEPGASVAAVSSIWSDLALERQLPIVPVAFRGGIRGQKVDLPVAGQTIHIGEPIFPGALAALPYAERRKHLAAAIDALQGAAPAPDCGWDGLEPTAGLGRVIHTRAAGTPLATALRTPRTDWDGAATRVFPRG